MNLKILIKKGSELWEEHNKLVLSLLSDLEFEIEYINE